ncbi:unnamed protein product [Rotaria socialis]|uniref:Uncharacterized protein n=1 Tax=Rotaria socialis TaxID=392032 RepID=A0A820VIX9_9BILA|nr:unnamed protein product [Rotaria socialis]
MAFGSQNAQSAQYCFTFYVSETYQPVCPGETCNTIVTTTTSVSTNTTSSTTNSNSDLSTLSKFLLIRDDTTDKNGLSRFSVLDSSEKQYLYRLKNSNDDSNLLLIVSYPSKDVLGYVGNEWRNETLNVTFEIYNSTINQWTNGTIKKLPNLFTEKYLIEWNSQNFMMKKKLFSIHHKFYDECENVLAQFRMRFRWFNWRLIKYNLELFSDKLPEIIYFFLIAIVDNRNIFK